MAKCDNNEAIYKGKCVTRKVGKVLKMMKKQKVESEFASPNFVADFSWNRGIRLTSDEVVEISNIYEG